MDTILVICYTNHALDQFLEDLMEIGIPANDMVRLGSKSSSATKRLGLFEQASEYKRSRAAWDIIDKLREIVSSLERDLSKAITDHRDRDIPKKDYLQYLEFLSDDLDFESALRVPVALDRETIVGKGGKAIGPNYLLDQWSAGKNAGVFRDVMAGGDKAAVWNMPKRERESHIMRWRLALLRERVGEICELADAYDHGEQGLDDMFNEGKAQIIRNKRVVGCTTTGAAMYARELQACSPGIVVVEEAGEVLEAHILSALGANAKQLVLIGDHKQLRPKVNNYALTVEKGEGYDLNLSMFERLMLAGFSHTTLQLQHRMRPEISSLIRNLTYPDLLDAAKTKGRPALRGFSDSIIFVNHDRLERDFVHLADRRDENSKSSKENLFEVQMILQCVRYLGQQGYRTNEIVVLTPYLGQLKLLRDMLSKTHDPILNDLDSYDLVQAGLMPAATASMNRRPIKISTIGMSFLISQSFTLALFFKLDSVFSYQLQIIIRARKVRSLLQP